MNWRWELIQWILISYLLIADQLRSKQYRRHLIMLQGCIFPMIQTDKDHTKTLKDLIEINSALQERIDNLEKRLGSYLVQERSADQQE